MSYAINTIVKVCKEHEYCDCHCPFYDRRLGNCEFDMTPDNWDLERIADICLSIVEEVKKK